MAYATITDVFARYKPIGSMVGAGSLDTTSVDVSSIFIQDAEGIINAHLASRYVVPVTTEPLVTMLSSDLAISAMLLEKLGSQPPFMESRYNRAMDMLKKLSEGELLLVASGTLEVTSGDSEAWSTTGSYHPVFSPVLDPLDQSVDVDYVDAEKNVRADD
jgi:phage gp36-like protein